MEQPKKLGFGMMRLPRKRFGIDIKTTCAMVDLFMDAGFTYFDTAFMYLGSEKATKKALIDRYPRDSFTIATKLFAAVSPSARIARKEFDTSLARTGAGYFDYYLLHSLMEANYKRYEKLGLWDFVREKKEQGLIRHIGFSFHGSPELLEKILTEHPEAEFVQLQINYADWEDRRIASRQNYEIARRFGKPIVVMEPVKGGNLANPPKAVRELLKAADPNASYASWAIRFAASLDGILTVLSGMSDVQQVTDNISYMKEFKPLSESEREILRKARELLGQSQAVPCTACRYCTEGCPKKIVIPEIFKAANLRTEDGRIEEADEAYRKAVSGRGKASDCIACGQCERVCPQHIGIIEELKKSAAMFEKKAAED